MDNSLNDYGEENNDIDEKTDVLITDEVIAVIAAIAASEVEGVHEMSKGFTGGIVEALGGDNPAKGVRVETINEETIIDLYVIVKYGYRIPDIAFSIQEKVKDTVESLTSVIVSVVNIHIQGVSFEDESDNELSGKD